MALDVSMQRHTGDLDDLARRGVIRALLVLDPVSFCYDDGKPKGIVAEALQAFQEFANQKLKTGAIKLEIAFVPRPLGQLEAALQDGIGDLIAYGLVVTPDRQQRVNFSVPIQGDVRDVVVTGPAYATVNTIDDLSGKNVFVNPLAAHAQNLRKVSDGFVKAGKPPIIIKAADPNLSDGDLLEMVNAGLIPATVVAEERANLWSHLLPKIRVHHDMVVASGQNLAWAMRKDGPALKALVDEFVNTRMAGSSFGNALLRRYMENPQWVRSATSEAEKKKFDALAMVFEKYGKEYGFDYLMLAAQGYQESQLEQDRRSPAGDTVGIMQVNPEIAAAPPIAIKNVTEVDGNIHAGAKMLRQIADDYFNDPAIDPVNRTLLTFASYNAGPNRIKHLRDKARAEGLDPNVWFGNVELMVAREVGTITVTYVGNIYKYYVAYKLAMGEAALE